MSIIGGSHAVRAAGKDGPSPQLRQIPSGWPSAWVRPRGVEDSGTCVVDKGWRAASVTAEGAGGLCCSVLTGPTLTQAEASGTAAVLKALADRHRVRIVNLLANSDSEVCVCDITAHVGLSQPTTSFHLKKLMDAGLLLREQRGTWAYYSLNRSVLGQLQEIFEVREAVR